MEETQTEESILKMLKAAEKEIQEAEAQVTVRREQLEELKPKRAELEAECLEKYGCTPQELPQVLADKSENVQRMVQSFVSDLKAAKA